VGHLHICTHIPERLQHSIIVKDDNLGCLLIFYSNLHHNWTKITDRERKKRSGDKFTVLPFLRHSVNNSWDSICQLWKSNEIECNFFFLSFYCCCCTWSLIFLISTLFLNTRNFPPQHSPSVHPFDHPIINREGDRKHLAHKPNWPLTGCTLEYFSIALTWANLYRLASLSFNEWCSSRGKMFWFIILHHIAPITLH